MPSPNAFVFYDASGRVTGHGMLDADSVAVSLNPGERAITGMGSADSHYVDVAVSPHRLCVRQDTPAILSGQRLSGVPVPATIVFSGPAEATFRLASAEVALSADVPGRYQVVVTPDAPMWRPYRCEVEL